MLNLATLLCVLPHACVISVAVTSFWAALSFLLLFAYPTPEFPTPSFEFHTAFNGVAFGIVSVSSPICHRNNIFANLNLVLSSRLF